MQAPARIWRHFDVWLLATVALLTIAGVAMIRSAIADNPELVELNVVGRQAVFGLVSLVLLLATAAIDYRVWAALSRPIYIFNLIFLALIPIAGVAGFGSARWFQLATVTIQPGASWLGAASSYEIGLSVNELAAQLVLRNRQGQIEHTSLIAGHTSSGAGVTPIMPAAFQRVYVGWRHLCSLASLLTIFQAPARFVS